VVAKYNIIKPSSRHDKIVVSSYQINQQKVHHSLYSPECVSDDI
jgi:hypothetical protein